MQKTLWKIALYPLSALVFWLSVALAARAQTGISGSGDPYPDPPPIPAPAVTGTITSGADANGNSSTSTTQPVAQGSVFTQVQLPLSGTGQAAVATMTLSYGAALAGQVIWVQPLRGGTCTSPSVAGSATLGSGIAITLDASGTAVLTFQPPNKPGTYKVLVRQLNAASFLSFVVPAADS